MPDQQPTALHDFASAGRSRTFAIADALNPLTYKANVYNGKPILRAIASTSAYVNTTDIPSIPGSSPFVAWLVAKTNGADTIFMGRDDGSNNQQFRLNYGANRQMFLYSGASYAGAGVGSNLISSAESMALAIYLYVRDGSGIVRFYYNSTGRFTADQSFTGAYTLRSLVNVFGLPLTGDIGEMGVSLVNPSLADLNSLGSFLATKWGLSWLGITA